MYKHLLIVCFAFALEGCTTQPHFSTPIALTQTIPKLQSPTSTKESISSPIPIFDPYEKTVISPNGNFSAKMYVNIDNPSEKPVIEIWDKVGKVLWKIPYQGTWYPDSAPSNNMTIYGWSPDSAKVYFYYSFSYDGWYTLFDGSDLQSIDAYTGKVDEVLMGVVAFDFSSDMTQVAYTSNNKVGILDLVRILDKSTAILPGNYEQNGWIHISPNNDKVIFHTLDSAGTVKSIFLNTNNMKQSVILEFVVESIFFGGWTQNETPSYWELSNNTVFEINTNTLSQVIIGTATPYP